MEFPSAGFRNVRPCWIQVWGVGPGVYFLPFSLSASYRHPSMSVLQDIAVMYGMWGLAKRV